MKKSAVDTICLLSNCTIGEIKSGSRKLNILRARQILISYNHLVELKTQHESAIEFNRSHSTTIHSIKSVQNDYLTDKNYKTLFMPFLESNRKILNHKFNHYNKK